jgi:hypothetical protein
MPSVHSRRCTIAAAANINASGWLLYKAVVLIALLHVSTRCVAWLLICIHRRLPDVRERERSDRDEGIWLISQSPQSIICYSSKSCIFGVWIFNVTSTNHSEQNSRVCARARVRERRCDVRLIGSRNQYMVHFIIRRHHHRRHSPLLPRHVRRRLRRLHRHLSAAQTRRRLSRLTSETLDSSCEASS